ncbi:MAG: S41 family peptidase [Sinobacteraceae bacterium]|nr:S41 family peptidase [Nevskiaceae bacterium]
MKRGYLWLVAAGALAFGAALGWLLRTDRPPAAAAGSPSAPPVMATPVAIDTFGPLPEIMTQIRREYVDELSAAQLTERAARSMVASLDAHSALLDQREYEELRRGVAGNYPGIGIEVTALDNAIRVLRPLPDSPAARAGLLAGDVILRIDGAPVGANVGAAIEQMRGPAGSLVKLTVRRAVGNELVDLVLERARVEVHSVTVDSLAPGYAYVRIASFSDTTVADFERAVAAIRREPPLRGVLLDVRNNPGGVLEAAVGVADALLTSGTIVRAEGRGANARFTLQAQPGELLPDVAVAVLMNGASASAAEILAGALKDNARALLVGRRTYGKGTVQSIIPLSQGRALKLTTSRYARPSGEFIDQKGIEPDVYLPGPETASTDPAIDEDVRFTLRELQRRTTTAKAKRT